MKDKKTGNETMENKKVNYKKEIEEIIRYSALLYERRMVSAAGGNVSVRCGSDSILITVGGASLRALTWENVLLCSMNGEILDGDKSKKPSKEYRIHVNSYLARPTAASVIHIHPSCAIAVTAYNIGLPLFTASAKLKLREVPVVGEAEPGTEKLANNVKTAVEDYQGSEAFLLKAHGAVVLGTNLEQCFDTAELLEDTARIALLAKESLLVGRS